jgi:hypothetical protein
MTIITRAEVFCTLQIEGTHCWIGCDIGEVDYLRSPHRHVFHIKAYAAVNHDDRNIEFIELKHKLLDHFKPFYDKTKRLHVFGERSCEMIARELIETFNLTECEVSEDGENGCRLIHTLEQGGILGH